jgi:hypothetical protein
MYLCLQIIMLDAKIQRARPPTQKNIVKAQTCCQQKKVICATLLLTCWCNTDRLVSSINGRWGFMMDHAVEIAINKALIISAF